MTELTELTGERDDERHWRDRERERESPSAVQERHCYDYSIRVRKQKTSHTPRNVSSMTHNGKIKIIKGNGNYQLVVSSAS